MPNLPPSSSSSVITKLVVKLNWLIQNFDRVQDVLNRAYDQMNRAESVDRATSICRDTYASIDNIFDPDLAEQLSKIYKQHLRETGGRSLFNRVEEQGVLYSPAYTSQEIASALADALYQDPGAEYVVNTMIDAIGQEIDETNTALGLLTDLKNSLGVSRDMLSIPD